MKITELLIISGIVFLAILLALHFGIMPVGTVVEKDSIITTIKPNEITVEWQEKGLHRKFWCKLTNASITLLEERADGYVDWSSDRGIVWDTRRQKVNSNPWK